MSRHYKNSWIGQEQSVIVNSEAFQGVIKERVKGLLEDLVAKIQVDRMNDHSVYTGSMGIALLYFHLDSMELGSNFLNLANVLLQRSIKHLRRKGISFMDGDAGTLTIGILITTKTGNTTLRQELVQRFVDLGDIALDKRDTRLANEFLYGRAGYLYSLLLLNSKIPGLIDTSLISKVVRVLIDEGKKAGHSFLYYEWHDKCYLGAVHGIAGIVYILLQVREHLTEDDISWVKKTADWLLTQRFPSGNLPSSFGSKDDRLIHFCHGAPGAIYTFIIAHQVFGDSKYLEAATSCADEVWTRGLLRKGYSLCHGVSGNAYALRAFYEHTKDEKYLHRAYVFAQWCFDYGKHCEHPPDRPLSLFEGQAGAVYMLADFGFNSNPKFPAFQL